MRLELKVSYDFPESFFSVIRNPSTGAFILDNLTSFIQENASGRVLTSYIEYCTVLSGDVKILHAVCYLNEREALFLPKYFIEKIPEKIGAILKDLLIFNIDSDMVCEVWVDMVIPGGTGTAFSYKYVKTDGLSTITSGELQKWIQKLPQV